MMVQLRRIWIQLTSDRKRFGILCAVLGIGLLLWARIIVISNTPRTAVADETPETELVDDSESDMSIDTENRSRNAPKQVRLMRTPRRDPFVISSEHFPNPKVVGNSEEEQGKSAIDAAEDSQARVSGLLREMVETLTLDAVMSGPPPMAVINGVTYRIGDEVPAGDNGRISLTLVDVGQRRVLLKRDDFQFDVKMPTPKHQ